MEGKCFLKPKAADKEKLKALPPPEEIMDPDDGQVSAQVIDSDDEADLHVPTPTPPVVVPVVKEVPKMDPVPHEVVDETVEVKAKPKAKIVRKKTDA